MASPIQSNHHRRSGASFSSPREPTGTSVADALSVEEHGRQFNAYREGKYLLPNDADEQDRLDLQHKLWTLMLGDKLYLAPIGEPANVLDIGTGTGIWAKYFARLHPTSDVVGTDISLIQPTEKLPSNLTFIREDAEDMWVHDHPFEYIHWRLMCTCFGDFHSMIARVYDHLEPGGWAEFHDFAFELVGEDEKADEIFQASAVRTFFRTAVLGGAANGKDFEACRKLRHWMLDAGFVDVVEKPMLLPLNGWPQNRHDKLLGQWSSLDILKFLDGATKLLVAGGMSLEEIPAFLDQVRLDVTNRDMRVYSINYAVYGRKPFD